MAEMYQIRSSVLTLKDSPQHIDFHIQSGDYISYIATVVGFIEEALELRDGEVLGREKELARELRNDLRYVHANYRLIPRELGDIQTVQKKGNLLGN